MPIIPLVLANGGEGIGTGWASRIPNYDVREIINNIHRMLNGEEPLTMVTLNLFDILSQMQRAFPNINIDPSQPYLTLHFKYTQLPSYKGFKGTIDELAKNQYVNNGEVAIIDSTTIEITELPVKTWTQVCKICLCSTVTYLQQSFFMLPFNNKDVFCLLLIPPSYIVVMGDQQQE